jgi:hypothetical protein
MWCSECTDPVLRCFVNLEGPNYSDLLGSVVPQLPNGLRLSIEVPSQDLSGAWVTDWG